MSDVTIHFQIYDTNNNNGNPKLESYNFKDEDVKSILYKIIKIITKLIFVIITIIGGIGI